MTHHARRYILGLADANGDPIHVHPADYSGMDGVRLFDPERPCTKSGYPYAVAVLEKDYLALEARVRELERINADFKAVAQDAAVGLASHVRALEEERDKVEEVVAAAAVIIGSEPDHLLDDLRKLHRTWTAVSRE